MSFSLRIYFSEITQAIKNYFSLRSLKAKLITGEVFFMLQVNIFLLVFCILSVNSNFTYSVTSCENASHSDSGCEDSRGNGFSCFPFTHGLYKHEVEYNMRVCQQNRETAQCYSKISGSPLFPITCAVDCATLPFRLLYFAGRKTFKKV